MRKMILVLFIVLFFAIKTKAQNTFRAILKDAESREALMGATALLLETTNGGIADIEGKIEIFNIPNGTQTIKFSYVGYADLEKIFVFPFTDQNPIEILLKAGEELEEVIVATNRTSRRIEDVPTRIDVIAAEEIEEKTNMRPANVAMVLHESTGIQVQQTSPTSANAGIRIQGLDGRYTQILKDGFPNYSGLASGLSILEIPPLDLRQVEVVKGPASTLYGGGAVAGAVNFISRTPTENTEFTGLINQSHIGQTDIAGFLSGKTKSKKFGYTFLVSANLQRAYDVDKDEFTELPKMQSYGITPKFFFYLNDKTTFSFGNSLSLANRLGGDINYIKGNGDATHVFFEENETFRNISTLELNSQLKENQELTVKQSFSFFDRTIKIPNYSFGGVQYYAYTDASLLNTFEKHTLITGLNVVADVFKEDQALSGLERNINFITWGIYGQDTWDVSKKLVFENGFRIDYNTKHGVFILPRISLMYRPTKKITTRIGGGLGYKLPAIFTEQAENLQYQNIVLSPNVKPERSIGGTADINYREALTEDLFFSVNQLFFVTQINQPLTLIGNSYDNAAQPTQSYGFETNVKFTFKNQYKFFAGYTFTKAKARYLTGNQTVPLQPSHKLNLVLLYEVHENIKLGIESYYTGYQYFSNGNPTNPFWEFGAFIEKRFKNFALFVNAENFTDIRQSRFKTVSNPPHNNPTFDEIFTHTEGRVINGGIKVFLK